MPRGDGTGPNGMGSGTGRAMGYCSGAQAPGYARTSGAGPGRGRGQAGFGRGCGRGRGRGGFGGIWRRGIMDEVQVVMVAQEASQTERQYLQGRLKAMEASLAVIKARLESLDSQA